MSKVSRKATLGRWLASEIEVECGFIPGDSFICWWIWLFQLSSWETVHPDNHVGQQGQLPLKRLYTRVCYAAAACERLIGWRIFWCWTPSTRIMVGACTIMTIIWVGHFLCTLLSSANNRMFDLMLSCMSLIYNRNKTGPSTNPSWGTHISSINPGGMLYKILKLLECEYHGKH